MSKKFQIIAKDWYKRRKPTQDNPIAVSVEIPDYQQVANHLCAMDVMFDNGVRKTLIARVIYNKMKGYWTVDGMEVAVKVLED